MTAAGVPTAQSRTCTTAEEVAAALDTFGAPYVVKDDGLAAGKGVVVTTDRDEALAHAAGCERVVVEDYLDGPEVSLFCLTDGTDAVALLPAQDFKRVGDGDSGPNTGGMGAYAPLDWAPPGLVEEVLRDVVRPTVAEMAARGTPFAGLLYVGPGADLAGDPGGGVQRPLRRPGDAGRPGPARDPARAGCCTLPRPAPSGRTRRCAGARAPR